MCVAQENLRRTERLEHRLYGMEEARGLYPGEYPILDFSLQNTAHQPVARAAQTLTWNGGTEEFPSPPLYRDAAPDKSKVILKTSSLTGRMPSQRSSAER